MTAHPKEDPGTRELHFFGYSATAPFLTYHVLSAGGELVRSEPIQVTGPTMIHDFAITERYVIWLDLPMSVDFSLAGKRALPFAWNDDYPARIGVMPKGGGSAQVRWIDVDPCYVFHVANACDNPDGTINLDAVRYSPGAMVRMWHGLGGHADLSTAQAQTPSGLHRWVLDPVRGTARERVLGEESVEFPTINESLTGLAHRYVYSVVDSLVADTGGVLKYDLASGAVQRHQLEQTWRPGEAVFVPAPDATGEDEGWLLSVTSSEHGEASRLLVLDATDLAAGPVAQVHLPTRVPLGFHGSWISDEELGLA